MPKTRNKNTFRGILFFFFVLNAEFLILTDERNLQVDGIKMDED